MLLPNPAEPEIVSVGTDSEGYRHLIDTDTGVPD